MENSALTTDAYRLVKTMQVFGAWIYKESDPIQRELLTKKFVRLDMTRTRLMLTEWGRAVPRALGTH